MSLTLQEVKKIAKLARIKMGDEEIAKYQTELNKIFSWIEQLSEVNTNNVDPMYSVIQQPLVMREDTITDGGIRDKVLQNAPDSKYGFFVVPKVVE
jgi:aspartyl-tRNA(Asn)/glutamyl-tRNA(Gln) amidotransferase subunit C